MCLHPGWEEMLGKEEVGEVKGTSKGTVPGGAGAPGQETLGEGEMGSVGLGTATWDGAHPGMCVLGG